MLTKHFKLLEQRLALDSEIAQYQPQFDKLRKSLDKYYLMLLLSFIELNLPESALLNFYQDLENIEQIVKNQTEIEKFFVKYLQLIPKMTLKLEAYFETHFNNLKYDIIELIQKNQKLS